jgi:hypothetical protein
MRPPGRNDRTAADRRLPDTGISLTPLSRGLYVNPLTQREEIPMRRLLPFTTCVLVICLSAAARAQAPQDAKPDAEGFIRDWLMLAPFPIAESSGADEIDKKQIENESALKPKAGDKQKVNDKEATWKAAHAKDFSLDLNEAVGTPNEDVVGYLVTYVVADKEMPDLTLLIGSNDEAKVYLNGKEVIKFDQTRVVEKDSDKSDKVTLNKGVNTVVFKVINEKNDWGACLRFKDKDGKPVTNVKVQLTP